MMLKFFFLYKDTLSIRRKPCAIWEVWAYPLRIEQTFSTPQIYRQLEGPNCWKQQEMAKRQLSLKYDFWKM